MQRLHLIFASPPTLIVFAAGKTMDGYYHDNDGYTSSNKNDYENKRTNGSRSNELGLKLVLLLPLAS